MSDTAATSNADLIISAIRLIKTLRVNTQLIFCNLADGVSTDESTNESDDKNMITNLQRKLTTVTQNIRDLEQIVNSMQPFQNHLFLGTSGFLSHDPSPERSSIYPHVIDSYKWIDKIHEYSSCGHSILTQNSLKRSNINLGMSTKRRRNQPTSHNVPSQAVDTVINTFCRTYSDMTTNIYRPYGSNAVVLVTLGRILKSLIMFKGLMIEWVSVKGFNEDFITENNKIDLWSKSNYKVFQKVTQNANAAMLHFYSPLFPDLSVRSFMTWFHSFITLFTAKCKKCNNHLNNNMPPTWREFRTLDSYHEDCRPSC